MGLWLFASAFVLPQSRGQFAATAICGALTVLFAALTSYSLRSRYVTAAVGVLVVVLAFAVHSLGSATFWHNAIIGISIAVAAVGGQGSTGRPLRARPLWSRQRLGRNRLSRFHGSPGQCPFKA